MILILIVALLVQIVLAVVFACWGEEKCHSFWKCFFVCFFLSLIGYLMVAAMPDNALRYKIDELRNELKGNQNASQLPIR